MVGNIGETQETTTNSYNHAALTPGSQLHTPFIPRSSGSYMRSNVLNCANGSDTNSSTPWSSGLSRSSSMDVRPISSDNGIPFVSALSESCRINNTANAGSLPLHRSSGSYSRNIQANFSSTLEGGVTFLPRSSGSCTKSTTSSPGNICRICHDGESEEKLVSPCLCAGTQGLIHKTCLERWLSTASYDNCELCRFPFHLKKKPKTFLEFLCHKWEPDMRRAITGDLLCFLVLTPLTLVSAYLCGRGAIQYFTDRDYYNNRIRESDQDLSIFSSPFSKRYRDRQIPRERLIIKTSMGAAYVEKENSFENKNKFDLPDDNETEPLYMEASGLIVLAVMLVVIYSCWLAIAVRYHVKALRRWQRDNQDLVLVDVSNPGPICRLNLSFMSNNSPPRRSEHPQIYTLPESSFVDLDEQREQRMSLVPQVHSESRRSSMFSPSNNTSVTDSGRRKSNSRVRSISECIRRLSESDERRDQRRSLVPQVHNESRRSSMFSTSKSSSVVDSGRRKSNSTVRRASEYIRRLSENGRKSSILVGRRASDGGRRSSIFSGCLSRENSPTRCLMYEELSGKALLDTLKNRSIKRYGTVNSLDGSPSKKYLEDDNTHYNKSKSPTNTYKGATWIDIEETKPSKANANTLLTKKKVKTSISPVAPEMSIPIYLEDYESPESYRIACAMYAEAMYNGKIAQKRMSSEHTVGIHQFPCSPSHFNNNRRNSTRSTHL